MKVLVLGSNGFIGSEVIESLLNNKSILGLTKIVGIDKQQDKIEKKYLSNEIHLYSNDISKSSLQDILKDETFDVIINSAASVGVEYVCNNSISTSDNNLSITRNVYNYISDLKKKNKKYNPLVIFFSSSEVYGNSETSDPSLNLYNVFPNTSRGIYAITKLLEENYYNLLYFEHEIPNVIILRLFNIVGPAQSNDFVIKKLFSKISNLEEVYVSVNSYRRFCYINFLTESLINMIKTYSTGEVIYGTINFGSLREDNYISIKDLAYKIKKYCHDNLDICSRKINFNISDKEDILKRNFDPSLNINCTPNVLEAIENSRMYDLSIDEIIDRCYLGVIS